MNSTVCFFWILQLYHLLFDIFDLCSVFCQSNPNNSVTSNSFICVILSVVCMRHLISTLAYQLLHELTGIASNCIKLELNEFQLKFYFLHSFYNIKGKITLLCSNLKGIKINIRVLYGVTFSIFHIFHVPHI